MNVQKDTGVWAQWLYCRYSRCSVENSIYNKHNKYGMLADIILL
jgi:hypothetical protein